MLLELWLLLGVIVVVHVLSMAAAARAVGVPVRTVSLGLGRPVISWRAWRLRAIPLGGYVAFGDAREDEEARGGAGAFDD